MDKVIPFKCPVVTDEDISCVTRLLGLPQSAFYGVDGKDPRQDVLKSMAQLDIAACPGSGKTTLLVAKLAILARKWEYSTRGICVLSHTNVARNEIETKLGNSTIGRSILAYPHFVGTIHGFVTEYLASPWLRSLGYPIKLIDSEICESIRWKKLAIKYRKALEYKFVEEASCRIIDKNFNWTKKDGKAAFAGYTDTYKAYRSACEDTAREGFHCYDDMFIWALDLMGKLPWIAELIRDRFPLLFIDETQDNSGEQSTILSKVFMEGEAPVIRQRFGDSNQAIFDHIGIKESSVDCFPNEAFKKDIPNSYRFGQTIANLADSLGVDPYDDGLKGQGPWGKPLASGSSEGKHTIFLCTEDNISQVMEAYGALILDTFSEGELKEGTFKAVGQIHKDNGKDQKPRHVGDYWSEYDPELARPDPKPGTFLGYVFIGLGRAKVTGEAYHAVEKIAEGILRLASKAEGTKIDKRYWNFHRYVLDLLVENPIVRNCYQDLIDWFVIKKESPLQETWNGKWREVVREIGAVIAEHPLTSQGADDFLVWDKEESGKSFDYIVPKSRDNLYRYPAKGPKVSMRVGSIHSVKGETHTATLVLETFWYKYNLDSIKDWLWRDDYRGGGDGNNRKRLKVHYVAMTRPTHLLCLAMQQKSFEDKNGVVDQQVITKLKQRGWDVKII